MDKNLNYIEHLEKTIKKATSRVKLLGPVVRKVDKLSAG
jgi:hypothetical protein